MEKVKQNKLDADELADYGRTHVPKGRWADTWNIVKNNFSKLVLINLFVLLFFIPSLAVLYLGNAYILQLGTIYPFASNVGLGYYAYPDSVGLAESLYLSNDIMFYSVLVVTGFIASIGIAGGMYSMRKLINTNGDFTIKGFFHGVKVGYFNVVFPVTIFLVFLFGSVVVSDWAAYTIAIGGNKAGAIAAEVCMIISTVVVGIICAWLIAVGCTYKVKLKYLIKNSFMLLAGSIVQTVFMAAFSLIPVWIVMLGNFGSLFTVIGYMIFIVCGFSFILLCWTSFTQWVFDMYVTPAVKKEKEAERAKKTPKQLAEESAEEQRQLAMELLAAGKSELIGRPIKPIDSERAVKPVGAAFTRGDLQRVSDERKQLNEDLKAYTAEHEKDAKYVEYNKMFAEREKALQDEGKKGKKKKQISSDNLLH